MTTLQENSNEEKKSLSFVEQMVEQDLAEGKNGGRIQTRFPPEPNGYLHIGHAKAICMDFGVAENYNGVCNLRFDDTNPSKEDTEYVDSILQDIKWLGFKWGNVYYASDYFEKLWDFAIWMIEQGKAYVDEQTSEQIAEQKGTPTQPGTPSPYRDRPIEENLRLFRMMNTPEAVEGIIVQVPSGTLTRCMTLLMDKAITSRVLPIPSVLSSLFLTVRSTITSWMNCSRWRTSMTIARAR